MEKEIKSLLEAVKQSGIQINKPHLEDGVLKMTYQIEGILRSFDLSIAAYSVDLKDKGAEDVQNAILMSFPYVDQKAFTEAMLDTFHFNDITVTKEVRQDIEKAWEHLTAMRRKCETAVQAVPIQKAITPIQKKKSNRIAM